MRRPSLEVKTTLPRVAPVFLLPEAGTTAESVMTVELDSGLTDGYGDEN